MNKKTLDTINAQQIEKTEHNKGSLVEATKPCARIWAISDLHLSFACDKPMDVFGGSWTNYTDKIAENWQRLIAPQDIVLVAGDISWGMKLEEAIADLQWLDKLNGHKIIIKGNHEYWWKSISAVREILPPSITAIQNDSIKIGNYIFCGTRGWNVPRRGKQMSEQDQKLYKREAERLKLTLQSMQKLREPSDKVVCMIHYPPYNVFKDPTLYTQLFEEYLVDTVVFGHLHGLYVKMEPHTNINGIDYYFTSIDHINNTPVLLGEIELDTADTVEPQIGANTNGAAGLKVGLNPQIKKKKQPK